MEAICTIAIPKTVLVPDLGTLPLPSAHIAASWTGNDGPTACSPPTARNKYRVKLCQGTELQFPADPDCEPNTVLPRLPV